MLTILVEEGGGLEPGYFVWRAALGDDPECFQTAPQWGAAKEGATAARLRRRQDALLMWELAIRGVRWRPLVTPAVTNLATQFVDLACTYVQCECQTKRSQVASHHMQDA